MEYKFIDSHAHLSSSQTAEVADEMIVRGRASHVEKIINVCTDKESLEKGLLLQEKWEGVFCAAAIPPHDIEKNYEEEFAFFAESAQRGDLIAIGETGLDYYYKNLPKDKQKACLMKHLLLAKECNLPVIFHCREAFFDLFQFCDEYFPDLSAVIHCFTGNREEALEAVKRGWYVSFSGIVTFKKSQELREIVKHVPLKQLLIETDTPYLAPESKRGKQNEPSYLPETAAVIAREKDMSLFDIAKATAENAARFFSLPI